MEQINNREELRFKNLKLASIALGQARSREGCDYAQRNPDNISGDGPKKFYNPEGLRKNAILYRQEAKDRFRSGCVQCPLNSVCQLAFKFGDWEKEFQLSRRKKDTPKNIETLEELFRRLQKKTNENHTEPCKDKYISKPIEQLTLDI